MNISGRQLKTSIRGLNITQEEAARRLGVTRQKLSMWFQLENLGKDVIHLVIQKLNIDLNSSVSDLQESLPSYNTIPMYNAPAAAGGIEVYADTESGKVVGHISFPGITKGSYALQVYGTSMHPTLGSGAWVILRPIEAAQDIVWGEVYYIEWSSYRMFKRLLKGDSEDEVILWSDNQEEKIYDRPKHAPIHIKKEDIRKLSLMTDMYIKANH